MQPDDISLFAEHFRAWLATAQNLRLADLIEDSNAMVTEVVSLCISISQGETNNSIDHDL